MHKIDLKEALAFQILSIFNATPYIGLGPIVRPGIPNFFACIA